jgi:outer membrane protein OmpA-like peptidoglycan-associated protein
MAERWLDDVRKYVADADENVVGAIVKYCGIALQNRDSSLVAMSDAKERTLVRENYLRKKLGLTSPDAVLDEAVIAVGHMMKADRTKNRVTVYYLLARHFGSLGIFGGPIDGQSVASEMAGGAVGLAAMAPAPAAANASPSAGRSAPQSFASGGNPRDEFNLIGWGCGAVALVLSGIILAALLAWYADRPTAAPAPDAVSAVTLPVSTAPVIDAEAIPEGAGVTSGERDGKPMLTVYFDTAKSDVTKDLAAAAAKVKNYVANNAGAKLAVSGFNDPTGNATANAELSKKRAQAVGKALEDAGIPATVIALVKPAETTDTSGNNDNARRVEVKVQ